MYLDLFPHCYKEDLAQLGLENLSCGPSVGSDFLVSLLDAHPADAVPGIQATWVRRQVSD